jgi:hypothetical protein
MSSTAASILSSLAALRLPRPVHVLKFRKELGGEDVDFLVGAVQQAKCPNLVGGGRVVSGCFGFFAAVSGLEGCDFGGLEWKKRRCKSDVSRCEL